MKKVVALEINFLHDSIEPQYNIAKISRVILCHKK